MADGEDDLQIPLLFTGMDDTPVLLANQFAGQVDRGVFTLIVGHMSVPLLIGSPEEQREQARQIPSIPIKVLGRFAMTEAPLTDLIGMLQRQLAVLRDQDPEGENHVD